MSLAERGWQTLGGRLDRNSIEAFRALGPEAGPGRRVPADTIPALPEVWTHELEALGYDPQPRRAVVFHKSSDVNWSLPWHQDRLVSPPGGDAGRPREASLDVLERMAFAYIALDDIAAEAGGLQLAEGSHRFGTIRSENLAGVLAKTQVVQPAMRAGEALLVHMLTLHRSAVSRTGARRRSLRLDFGTIGARDTAL